MAKTVWVRYRYDARGWVFTTDLRAKYEPNWVELEVGEATLASWVHNRDMANRIQDEIEDMVDAAARSF